MNQNTQMARFQRDEGQGIGKGVGFERIRRITGYLVGDVSRFNDAKRHEVNDRVKHHVSRIVDLDNLN